MKKFISILIVSVLAFLPYTVMAKTNYEPKVSAKSAVLYCVNNGKVIYQKNADLKMKPASTTKLMTTLITLEYAASSNKKVQFSKEMTAEGSSMYLKLGDCVTLKDLATGMMMASGNDAANAAALSIAGSFSKFSDLMNKTAKQIGMKNTHFVTPSGLDDENHYTTAYDMALLMSYGLENDDFSKLTSQKKCTVNFIKPESKSVTYSNHNKLLSIYNYCSGGKTGFTKSAGRCLVSSAQKDGLTFVCVTLNDPNDWKDHTSLFDYGFSKYLCKSYSETDFCIDEPCVGGKNDSVSVVGEKDFSTVINCDDFDKVKRTVHLSEFLYAPIKKDEICGYIEYNLDGKLLGKTNLIAVNCTQQNKNNKNIWNIIKDLFTYG